MAQRCSSEELGILGASFFFKHDEAERTKAENVFPKIALDLAAYNRELSYEIASELSQPDSLISGLDRQFEAYIAGPIQRSHTITPIVIIIDAIDECSHDDDDHRAQLLDIIAREGPKLPSNVRIIIFSQPEEDIVDAFQTFQRHDLELDSSPNQTDLVKYVSRTFSDMASSKALQRRGIIPPWPKDELRQEFVKRTAGLFIWAKTALEYIKHSWDPDAVLLSLVKESIAGRGAQDSLYTLYKRALDSIEYIDQPTFAHEFRIVVGTLIVSRNPLSITTISQLIGDELGGRDIRGVLETMQSVLREIGSDSVPIRLLHSSFSDYLTDRTLCTDELRLIDRPTHHALMAQRCLRLMNSTLKRNICNLPDNLLFDEIDDLSSSVTTNIPPELRYACRYWVDHVTRSEGQENLLVDLSSKFLHAHSLEWLEVMSLIQETDDVADILQGLLRWARLQVSTSKIKSLKLFKV